MTEQNYPINPPPELVEKWSNLPLIKQEIIAIAWRNGADTELEACIEELYRLWDKDHIVTLDDVLKHLRAARRPKPPSLKEQALRAISQLENGAIAVGERADIIRRALESIPDPS